MLGEQVTLCGMIAITLGVVAAVRAELVQLLLAMCSTLVAVPG
jgi:hypothetical protein